MYACTLSSLELRSIVESAFLPLTCHCTIADQAMTVEIIHPETHAVELVVTGIALERLDTSRALAELISELRFDLLNTRHEHRHALAG